MTSPALELRLLELEYICEIALYTQISEWLDFASGVQRE
jgi:hypothetical protein